MGDEESGFSSEPLSEDERKKVRHFLYKNAQQGSYLDDCVERERDHGATLDEIVTGWRTIKIVRATAMWVGGIAGIGGALWSWIKNGGG